MVPIEIRLFFSVDCRDDVGVKASRAWKLELGIWDLVVSSLGTITWL